MPLDLQSELLRRQQATDEYLAGLPGSQDAALNSSRGELDALRSQFFGGVQPGIGEIGKNAGIAFNGSGARAATSRLSREAERGLAQRKYDNRASRLNMRLGLQSGRALNAFNDTQSANDFARQMQNAQTQNNFTAEQADLERQHGIQQQDKLDQFAQDQQGLRSSYLPQMDYEGALTRSLFGLGAGLGTAYAINKYGKGVTTQTDTPFPTSIDRQYGPSLPPAYYRPARNSYNAT